MSPSGNGNDYTFEMDPKSVLAAFRAIMKASQDAAKGVVGATDEMDKAYDNFSQKVITFSRRNEQAMLRQVQALQRTADAAGKTGVEKLVAQQDQWISRIQKTVTDLDKQRAAIDSVRNSYAKLIDVENKRSSGGHGLEGPQALLLRGARDLFEGRTAYGEVQIGKALAGMEGMPLIIGGVTAALAGLAFGGFEAAKSLGELGIQTRNVEERMGFSAKEVAQFGFAAKTHGQEVEIFQRMMRGLTQAVEEQSTQGDKSRTWLLRFGVDLRGVRDGTVSTSEVLKQVAEGMGGLQNPFERSKAAIDLFKRAGVEAIPVMLDLEEKIRIAKREGFGPDEADITRFVQINEQLDILGRKYDDIKRNLKDGLVIELMFVGKWVAQFFKLLEGGKPDFEKALGVRSVEQKMALGTDIDTANKISQTGGFGRNPAINEEARLTRMRMEALAGLDYATAYKAPEDLSDRERKKLAAAQDIERQMSLLQSHRQDVAKQAVADDRRADDEAVRAYERRQGLEGKLRRDEAELHKLHTPQEKTSTTPETLEYERREKLVAADKEAIKLDHERTSLRKQFHDAELSAGTSELSQYDRINEKWAKQLELLQENGAKLMSVSALAREMGELRSRAAIAITREQTVLNTKLDEEAAKELRVYEIEHQRSMLRIQQDAHPVHSLRELGKEGVTVQDVQKDIQAQYDLRIANARRAYDKEVDIARSATDLETSDRGKQESDARAESLAMRKQDNKLTEEAAAAQVAKQSQLDDLKQKAHDQATRFAEEMSKLREKDTADSIKSETEFAVKKAEIQAKTIEVANRKNDPAAGIRAEIAAAQREYDAREQGAKRIYAAEEDRIKLQETGSQAAISHERALNQLKEENRTAEKDFQVKQLEAQQKQAEMISKQIDEIKGKTEGLLHTLFTDSKNFGSQLKTTLRDAALKPIESGMAEMISRTLHPTIFGQGGTGGIAGGLRGIFGGQGGRAPVMADGTPVVWVKNLPEGGGTSGGLFGQLGGSGTASRFLSTIFSPSPGAGIFSAAQTGTNSGAPTVGSSPWSNWAPRMAQSAGNVLMNYTPAAGPSGDVAGPSNITGLIRRGPSDVYNIPSPRYYDQGIFNQLGGLLGAPGGTSGYAGPMSEGGTASTTQGGWRSILGNIFGGRQGQQQGLGGLFGGGGIYRSGTQGWGGITRAPGSVNEAGEIQQGKITGVGGIAGAGLEMGGMYLAQRGLLGNDRGTTLGIVEGTAGGAMIGMKYGGPLGAAIGAGVGFGIGLGEKLAGVESKRAEAKRLVHDKFHISIGNNVADQIVALAKEKYGDRVSVAVVSPEVRGMLGLYAAGTGQADKFPQSAGSPHGASLMESGGKLYQAPVYQYGNPYTYQSSLPVYGGNAGGSLPNPGGGGGATYLSLNISGASTGKFLDGQYVTPENIGDRYSAALASSYGRTDNAMAFAQPGSIIT